ncbi:MAG: hypothetical protein ACPGU5_03075, partial [Lishizhenia sp.]
MIRRIWIYLVVVCFTILGNKLHGQTSNFRSHTIFPTADTIQIDTLSIYQTSFKVYCGTTELTSNAYYLDEIRAKFKLISSCSDSLRLEYRVFDMLFEDEFKSKDTTLIFKNKLEPSNDFLYSVINKPTDFFGSSIQKS